MDFNELLNDIQQAPEVNFLDLINECNIDLAEEMIKPDILLSIGEYRYKNNMYPTPIMTSGECSAIIAVSKAKKSFLKSQFAASYIGGNSNINFPNIKTHRTEDFTVLDFDTEQGKYYAQRTFRRVPEITGVNYDHYHCYVTRHITSRQRLEMIDYCLANQKILYKKPVKLVFIDGIADLVDNTNDIVMSKEASDYLMKWTHDYNIHISTVIHKSGATGKPLGHLGTYILKKCESVIELEVNDDKSVTVNNPYSRGISFDEFTFDINTDSLPYLVE